MEDDQGDEGASASVRGWKIEHVFDISQTDGEPMPHLHPTLLEGEGPSGVWQALADQVTADGFQLLREAPEVGGALGSMNRRTQTVWVLPGLAEAQASKTLAHERAHMVLGHGSNSCTDPRSRLEVEAESVAFVVQAALGLDTSGYSLLHPCMELQARISTHPESRCLVRRFAMVTRWKPAQKAFAITFEGRFPAR